MKMIKSLLLAFVMICLCSLSYSQKHYQVAVYDKFVSQRSITYDSYISKSGDKLNVGDTLIIGQPSAIKKFNYIHQGGESIEPVLSGHKVVINQIKSYKNNLFMRFRLKGYGLYATLIQYEPALDAKEIINPNAKMTSAEALQQLKQLKDKLDLGLITQDQYNQEKEKLSKIIK